MTVGLRLSILSLALAGCGPSAPVARAERAPAVTGGPALFEDTCEPCHASGSEERPTLSASALSPGDANRALRELILRRMPPPAGGRLTQSERSTLALWLCSTTKRSDQECARVVGYQFRPVPTSDIYLARARELGANVQESDIFVKALRENGRASVRAQPMDATFLLLATGIALTACAERPEADRPACVAAYLEAAVEPIPPPPEDVP